MSVSSLRLFHPRHANIHLVLRCITKSFTSMRMCVLFSCFLLLYSLLFIYILLSLPFLPSYFFQECCQFLLFVHFITAMQKFIWHYVVSLYALPSCIYVCIVFMFSGGAFPSLHLYFTFFIFFIPSYFFQQGCLFFLFVHLITGMYYDILLNPLLSMYICVFFHVFCCCIFFSIYILLFFHFFYQVLFFCIFSCYIFLLPSPFH